jgi:hypothetical protein
MIAGTCDSGSFLAFPLLLDLGIAGDVARSGTGVIGVIGARAVPLLLDLDFDIGAAGDDAAAVGGPGSSTPLLLDLAGLADSVRFDSNFEFVGAVSIFGVWSPLGTDAGLLFIASALLSAFGLICSIPAGGGCCSCGDILTSISTFRCDDLPRRNFSIDSWSVSLLFCC